jgi:hypothetical protein
MSNTKFSTEMQTASYARNIEKGETMCDCIRCGKAIKGEHMMVEMENDMGWFPVGLDCAKKLSKLGVTVVSE